MVAPQVADLVSAALPLPTRCPRDPRSRGGWAGGGQCHPAGGEDAERCTAGWCAQALFPLLLARALVHTPSSYAIKFCPSYITTVLKVTLFILYSSSALPCIDNSSQFCVISKFHQQTPSFCAQVINQTLKRPHYRTWAALLPDSCAHTTELLLPHCGPPSPTAQPPSTAPTRP